MTLPETIDLDRGEQIKPEEVGRRVREYRGTLVPEAQNELQRNWQIVVHPLVFEDAYVRLPDLTTTGWAARPKRDALDELRCCGILVTADLVLRYDEVRMRREQPLP